MTLIQFFELAGAIAVGYVVGRVAIGLMFDL